MSGCGVGREEALRYSPCGTGSHVAPHLLFPVKSKIMHLMIRPFSLSCLSCCQGPVFQELSVGMALVVPTCQPKQEAESFGCSALPSEICSISGSVGSQLHLTTALVMSPRCFIWVREKHFPSSLLPPCPSCVCVHCSLAQHKPVLCFSEELGQL